MKNFVIALLLVAGAAFPYVVGLHVEPVKAQWSGWALGDENHGVWQSLTCNFDTVVYCELFAGSRGGGGDYYLSVLTNPGGSQIASANAAGDVDHKWVRFNLAVDYPESIVKGKKLTFKFTRSGGDSIEFYYDSTDQYRYGCLTAPPHVYATGDLACRVMGKPGTVTLFPFLDQRPPRRRGYERYRCSGSILRGRPGRR
jgi:hypothetical protein